MKNFMGKIALPALAMSAMFVLSACDVEKTQEGELPSVDVETQPGELPAYDVETPEVAVDTKEVVVEVPDVDVEMPNEPDTEVTDEQDSSRDDR